MQFEWRENIELKWGFCVMLWRVMMLLMEEMIIITNQGCLQTPRAVKWHVCSDWRQETLSEEVWLPGKSCKYVSAQHSSDYFELHSGNEYFKHLLFDSNSIFPQAAAFKPVLTTADVTQFETSWWRKLNVHWKESENWTLLHGHNATSNRWSSSCVNKHLLESVLWSVFTP